MQHALYLLDKKVFTKGGTHGKAIGIGEALWDGAKFKKEKTGKCVKSLYFVGDDVWGMGQS
jgi:predicted ribosome-associated RNA-binding protein Tma20